MSTTTKQVEVVAKQVVPFTVCDACGMESDPQLEQPVSLPGGWYRVARAPAMQCLDACCVECATTLLRRLANRVTA